MMWKAAFLTVGFVTGVACNVVYHAKVRDSKWLENLARKLQRREVRASPIWQDVSNSK
jgi:hypothetical protein